MAGRCSCQSNKILRSPFGGVGLEARPRQGWRCRGIYAQARLAGIYVMCFFRISESTSIVELMIRAVVGRLGFGLCIRSVRRVDPISLFGWSEVV